MARLPAAPSDAARIIPWARELVGIVERSLTEIEATKFSFPPGIPHFANRSYAVITGTGTGTSQATATPIAADLAELTTGTVGTGAFKLPGARPGRQVWASMTGTAAASVWPATSERIGTAGTNASVTLGVGTSALFSCVVAQRWQILRGA
jgi:hypothetical protein